MMLWMSGMRVADTGLKGAAEMARGRSGAQAARKAKTHAMLIVAFLPMATGSTRRWVSTEQRIAREQGDRSTVYLEECECQPSDPLPRQDIHRRDQRAVHVGSSNRKTARNDGLVVTSAGSGPDTAGTSGKRIRNLGNDECDDQVLDEADPFEERGIKKGCDERGGHEGSQRQRVKENRSTEHCDQVEHCSCKQCLFWMHGPQREWLRLERICSGSEIEVVVDDHAECASRSAEQSNQPHLRHRKAREGSSSEQRAHERKAQLPGNARRPCHSDQLAERHEVRMGIAQAGNRNRLISGRRC
eukprot:1120081-Rhodomonas_salina.2